MRLVLKLGAPWAEVEPADGEAVAYRRDDLPARLHTTPLYDRFAAPARRAAAEELGVEIVGETDAESTLGWPVHVVERVVTSAGARRRELDVGYELFELGGSVVVTGPADAIAADRDALLAVALTARPDFAGEVACVADLFAGVT